MYVFDGDEIGSTGQKKVMEMSGASSVNARKTINATYKASNDNTPFEAMKVAA
jgi:hypothetical protein